MEGRTHIIGGLAAGLAASLYTTGEPILLIGAAVIGGLLPDIDHPQSKVGRAVYPLSKLISAAVGHRTFTHSLLFMGLLLYFIGYKDSWALGLLVGIASHVFLDSWTDRGIKLFWPIPITFRLPITITTGGVMEKVFFAGLCVFSLYLGIELLNF